MKSLAPITLLLAFVLAAETFGMSSDCKTVELDGVDYTVGYVFLTAHADTQALRPYGFRQFEFLGRSVGRVRYAAIWPEGAALDSLPNVVSGVECEPAEAYEEQKTRSRSQEPAPWLGRPDDLSLPAQHTPNDGGEVFLDFSRRILVAGQLWPKPADKLPDSTIDGRPYVRGLVFVPDEDAVVGLEELGFRRLTHDPDAERHHVVVKLKLRKVATWDEENMEKIEFKAYRAYWPMDIVENRIPPELASAVITMLADSSSAPVIWRQTKHRD